MSLCKLCDGAGVVLICYEESNDYDAASCTCKAGQFFRTKWQLRAWAKQQTPRPVRIGRIEDFYTEKALAELKPEHGPTIAEMFL